MRFLGIGDSCELASLYLRLLHAGHEVKVFIAHPLCRDTLDGMIEKTADWKSELTWIRAAGEDGIILFEDVVHGRGVLQDELRASGFHVIGGSAYGDRLENDRAYSQAVLRDLGLQTLPVWHFGNAPDALQFLKDHPDRYVLKFNGADSNDSVTYVGHFADGHDVKAMLSSRLASSSLRSHDFILMKYVDGVEMGVGAYFNGDDFLEPACLDWEHKRFFPGDLGELTGEMGTVATFERSGTFFDATLKKVSPLLRRHGYCGYINLNTIVNEQGIWPLEFTCRFGYPGFSTLEPLQKDSWPELFKNMLTRQTTRLNCGAGYAVSVLLTSPPFPYTREQVAGENGLPLLLEATLNAEDLRHLHYGEVRLSNGQLVTSGMYGWTMVVTGVAATIAGARADAYGRVDKIHVPNMRFRNDIGMRLIEGELDTVEALGYLDRA